VFSKREFPVALQWLPVPQNVFGSDGYICKYEFTVYPMFGMRAFIVSVCINY